MELEVIGLIAVEDNIRYSNFIRQKLIEVYWTDTQISASLNAENQPHDHWVPILISQGDEMVGRV